MFQIVNKQTKIRMGGARRRKSSCTTITAKGTNRGTKYTGRIASHNLTCACKYIHRSRSWESSAPRKERSHMASPCQITKHEKRSRANYSGRPRATKLFKPRVRSNMKLQKPSRVQAMGPMIGSGLFHHCYPKVSRLLGRKVRWPYDF